jgi:septum formation protein
MDAPPTPPRAPVRFVLASASPQRRAILTQIGAAFDIEVSEAEELAEGPPEELVLENAFRKARAVADRLGPTRPVLGVDTVVALGRQIFHKPPDAVAARAALAALAGREHTVLSGVCLIEGDRIQSAAARPRVRFRALTAGQLDGYVETGEWRGRAGGYAIQERGALLVSSIEGDYLNIVGLPVATLVNLAPWLF